MTTAPLFTPDDLTTLATAVTYYGASVPRGMPVTEGYVHQVAKLRSLQARLQQWLDQHAYRIPGSGCAYPNDDGVCGRHGPHWHELDGSITDLTIPPPPLDESDLTNEG